MLSGERVRGYLKRIPQGVSVAIPGSPQTDRCIFAKDSEGDEVFFQCLFFKKLFSTGFFGAFFVCHGDRRRGQIVFV